MKTSLKLLLFSALFLFSSTSYSVNITASVTGNWEAPGTWDMGRVPGCGDVIIIPAGVTVSVTTNNQTLESCPPVFIHVYGTLFFSSSGKLELPCGSGIQVYPGGLIDGDGSGSSNRIRICGVEVWRVDDGPVTGPAVLGDPPPPLPIELISFTAVTVADNTRVELKWATASEKNNDFFTVERSRNGATFEQIAKVDGAGNSTTVLNYSAYDESPLEGTSYYRLKQTDFDGKFTFSNLVAVNYKKSGTSPCTFKVYPNPCVGRCTVSLKDCPENKTNEIEVAVIDALGNKVYSQVPMRDEDGSFSFSIDVNNNLKPGVYVVAANSANEKYREKVILN